MVINHNIVHTYLLNKLEISGQLTALEKLALASIMLTPIGYYLTPGWLSNFYALSSFLSISCLMLGKQYSPLSKEARVICFIFIAYPAAIFLSQFFRWDWHLKAYHDQSRFLLALPIFLFLYKRKIDIFNVMLLTIPFTILVGLISVEFIHQATHWGNRKTVSFIDPIAFGQMNVTFGLLCLSFIFCIQWTKANFVTASLLALGLIIGIYQSIYTQSRTGWLALILIPIILIQGKYKFRWFLSIPLTLLFFGLMILIGLTSSEIIQKRLLEVFSEIKTYPWQGDAQAMDSSVSLRITFWRVGWFYFVNSPFWGWGDKGFEHLMESPEITIFATKYAINFCYQSLFHNEFVTQSVRYGLLGTTSTIFIFLTSFFIFVKHKDNNNGKFNQSIAGLTLIICIFISGLTNEVFNLKHLVSINAFLLACLLSSTLISNSKANQQI